MEEKKLVKYFYSPQYKVFSLNPIFGNQQPTNTDLDKIQFWNQIGYSKDALIEFITDYKPDKIKSNLANLNQLLIEVTDGCNLQCKYCGYGNLYENHDKRNSKKQQFSNVKLLIDYLKELWYSRYNTSYNKKISVGFYGGEPLLNTPLIKETIAYLESFSNIPVHFIYNMTTNCMLLDRYMDFLVEKKFRLLLSLDGDELGSSYRVDKKGNNSFSRVFSNIKLLQKNYPEYFDKFVNFNAVLHDRNSVESIIKFVKQNFGKVPKISELNTNGLSKEGKKEILRMFKDRFKSFDEASMPFKSLKDVQSENSVAISFSAFVRDFLGNYYDSYFDLFDSDEYHLIPTGTCRPFEKKIYLTVNGKILPCERVGQEHVLGRIENGILNLNYEHVETYYKKLYEKVIPNCKTCLLKRSCGQCIFLLKGEKDRKNKKDQFTCLNYIGEKTANNYFAYFLSYAEENPESYEELMKNIAII